MLRDLPLPPVDNIGWPWTEESKILSRIMANGTEWPRISIVTPSYNQGIYLEETIRSVLLQGYPNLEYIIIDGGSKDDSVEIIKKYEPWLKYWVTEVDRGQSHAINKGFNHATGDLFAWLNSDDYYLPDALKTVAKRYRAVNGECVIYGCGDVVDANNAFLRERCVSGITRETILDWRENWFLQQACFWSRTCWEDVSGLDEYLHLQLDYDLWLRFADKYNFEFINKKLGCLRYYKDAKTLKYRRRSVAESIYVYMKNNEHEKAMSQLYELISSKDNALEALRKCESTHCVSRIILYLKKILRIKA